MKKIKIYWTPFASQSLDEIKGYIEKETQSEFIANKYITKLILRVEQLQNFPNSGREEELLILIFVLKYAKEIKLFFC